MEQVGKELGILMWRRLYGCVWLGRPTIHKLKTEYQWFKRISAGLTVFSGIKNAYRGRKNYVLTGCFFAHELARMDTNAMRGMDDWGRSCGVLPSRHIVLACLSEDFVPGYYRYALYCFPGTRPRLSQLTCLFLWRQQGQLETTWSCLLRAQ